MADTEEFEKKKKKKKRKVNMGSGWEKSRRG